MLDSSPLLLIGYTAVLIVLAFIVGLVARGKRLKVNAETLEKSKPFAKNCIVCGGQMNPCMVGAASAGLWVSKKGKRALMSGWHCTKCGHVELFA